MTPPEGRAGQAMALLLPLALTGLLWLGQPLPGWHAHQRQRLSPLRDALAAADPARPRRPGP
ncbi:hypothetical protein NON00_15725 [Roseomonas sp. GC11]|uniref:hypothetical protein n=1 Tax=Roseomonas sp. GC11 TaxID=2950546 RepID=UPI002109FE66|nr:hypothetical protein [Roseomonas sp. GC11]MCQ4161369.1 hypothetical protein [Roseomonas sp. GC11]